MRHRVDAGDRTYAVVDGGVRVYRALIVGTLRDEVTGGPPRGPFTVRTDRAGVRVRALEGGLFCVAGRPERVLPDLAAGAGVGLVVVAAGYREARLTVAVPAGADFPVVLSAPVLLRPLPVRLQGRVVEDTTAQAPVAGAAVRLAAPAGPPQQAVGLRTPLHFAHSTGVVVRERPLTPSGPSRRLVAPAAGGTGVVTLDSRAGLAVNDVLRFRSVPETRVEYAVIEALPASTVPPLPGGVVLRGVLNHTFPAGTAVEQVTPGAAGTARQLARAADAGDGVLVLDGALAADTVEVRNPQPDRVEYHRLGALTDAGGFYQLDGVGGLRTVSLTADVAGPPPRSKTVAWAIEYGRPTNVIDFQL